MHWQRGYTGLGSRGEGCEEGEEKGSEGRRGGQVGGEEVQEGYIEGWVEKSRGWAGGDFPTEKCCI